MVYSTYGKGKALIVGSFPGSAYFHFGNPANGKFYFGLAEWLKISRPVEVVAAEPGVLVEARVLEGDGYRILFGFNRGEKKTPARLRLLVAGKKFMARDIETKKDVPFVVERDRLVFEKTLEPGEAWAVLVKEDED
jgi:hypothetical protein